MSYKYDLFISHASEDKEFVRPLAQGLQRQRIAVWFDEFELRPGLGLRESIDRGLLTSRYGLVILSPDFFKKAWPKWELDGLVQLAHSRSEPSILPIWHNIEYSNVVAVSPSLANIVAIPSHNDVERIVNEVLQVLRPRPTAVEVAREILSDFGFPVPVLSDDWWLDAAVWSAPRFGEGTFQEASSWGWWGFPLPPEGDSAEAKGERIAWAAMQHSWQQAALDQKLTQCTEPILVLSFIDRQPGLRETCETHLDYLLTYAPQLGIPGCGGELEPLIVDIYSTAESSIKSDPFRGAPGWLLRDDNFCNTDDDELFLHYFWPTDPAGTSPDASVIATVDAAAWLTSSASDWLPPTLKQRLISGISGLDTSFRMARSAAEAWDIDEEEEWKNVMYEGPGVLSELDFVMAAKPIFEKRVASSCWLLSLPETPSKIVDVIASWGVFRIYWQQWQHRHSRKQKLISNQTV